MFQQWIYTQANVAFSLPITANYVVGACGSPRDDTDDEAVSFVEMRKISNTQWRVNSNYSQVWAFVVILSY